MYDSNFGYSLQDYQDIQSFGDFSRRLQPRCEGGRHSPGYFNGSLSIVPKLT